jgi:hypothetical protein
MKERMNQRALAITRAAAITWTVVALFSGCAWNKTSTPAKARLEPSPQELGATTPRIVSANPEHKFVVVDFTSQVMPEAGTLLNAYRGGKRIGAVRITEPVRAPFATADVVEGDLRVGDDIR